MQGIAAEAEGTNIRAAACPWCEVCGSEGDIIHSGQQDRLFGAPGTWSFKRCRNSKCGLVWLDPMPLTEDIGKAYANYYTHAAPVDSRQPSLLKRPYLWLKRGYLAGRYGYQRESTPVLLRLLGKLLRLFPLRRSDVDNSVRGLPAMTGGRLLDVGCGSGGWLASMRDLGWNVTGVDFDESAVQAAQKAGLNVTAGTLEEQCYPDESFDAVTLNHVIEHVPDPLATISECVRILKRGGRLILYTPNAASYGHEKFKKDWRGLEPPRHLHVFSPPSMDALLLKAGFTNPDVRTQNSLYVMQYSCKLNSGGTGGKSLGLGLGGRLRARWHAFVEGVLIKSDATVGECVHAVAVKR